MSCIRSCLVSLTENQTNSVVSKQTFGVTHHQYVKLYFGLGMMCL